LPGQSVDAPRVVEVGNDGQRIVLSVGSITKHKNQITLARAFERFCLTNSSGKDWQLVLVGHVSEDINSELLRILSDNENIVHLGHVSDERLRELYQSCSFTAFPSTEEGFGLPILESLWFAKPCICANYGAMAEVAEGGGCLTVDTRNVEAIASAIEALSTDDTLRNKLSAQAISREIPTWSEYASSVGELLDRLNDPRSKLGFVYYWIDHTISYPSNSGIQRTTRSLARSLLDQGVKLIPVKWDNQRYCLCPPTRNELEYFAKWNGPKTDNWSQWQDPAQVRPEDWLLVPELTTYLPSHSLLALRQYTRRLGLRCGIIFYDAIPWKMASLYPQAASDAHAEYMCNLAEFDKVFPISSHSKAELIKFYAHGAVRLNSFTHRFETCELAGEFFETPRIKAIKEPGESSARIKILCVSTVEPRKNHLVLLEAFAQLQRMTTLPIELVILGNDPYDDLAKQVQAIADRLSSVHWIRHSSDIELQKIYAECDFTVYPSVEEGYGLPIVESLWNARPCICSNQGAMGEIARGGGCLTVDVADVSGLAIAMRQLVENGELRTELARAAVSRKIKTWNEYAEEIILRLAGDRSPARRIIDSGRIEISSQSGFYSECINLKVRPLLSICITTYNRAQWLAVALDNLVRLLPDPVDDVEIVVCDNASTDHTSQVIELFQSRSDFRYVRNDKNVGMLGNLRVTAHHARGRYIWILGDDYLIKPGAVGRIIDTLRSRPDIDLVYLNYSYTREPNPSSISEIDKFLQGATPIVAPGPDIYAPIKEIATRSENFFTAIYCLVFRRDHALRAYSQNIEGRPFSSLLTCIPTTHYVLSRMMEERGCWLGEPSVVVNMNVSWIKYAPLWILERIPEVHDLAERMGASATDVDRWRVHNLPGFQNFWKSIFENDEAGNGAYFSPLRSITRIRHLAEYRAIAGDLECHYERARVAANPVADLPTSTIFPHRIIG
jgi:glycosyltransferase involved in cell wall biosynthesis